MGFQIYVWLGAGDYGFKDGCTGIYSDTAGL